MAMMHIAIETLCLGVSCHDYLFICVFLFVVDCGPGHARGSRQACMSQNQMVPAFLNGASLLMKAS